MKIAENKPIHRIVLDQLQHYLEPGKAVVIFGPRRTGIRNALINNFNPLEKRNDVGVLWENYSVVERLKKQSYQRIHANNYFWRTWDQKEVDWVEEREGKLFGFEFKWGREKVKPPKDFLETYANATFTVINQENYLEFVS